MAVTARNIMETQVVTLSPNDPLPSVFRLFFEEEIHGAPVVDDEGRVLGIVTSLDLLRTAVDEHDAERGDPTYLRELFEMSDADWTAEPEGLLHCLRDRIASEIMTEAVACVGPDASVVEIAQTLRSHHIHRVLVVQDDIVKGIVTTFDLVGLLEKPADPECRD